MATTSRQIRNTALAAGLAAMAALAAQPAAAACIRPANIDTLQSQLLAGLNAQRRTHGLPPLALNAALDKAAQGHACDNAKRHSISHDGSDGSQLGTRLDRVGYDFRTAAENTGRGFGTPTRAVEWWMNSPHHRDNILLPRLREIGIGIALSAPPENRLHWVIDMGTRG